MEEIDSQLKQQFEHAVERERQKLIASKISPSRSLKRALESPRKYRRHVVGRLMRQYISKNSTEEDARRKLENETKAHISDDQWERIKEADREYPLKELRRKCKEEGISTGGDKKLLIVKLHLWE